jgi:predicted ribosomally synthesized peptide with SipW-like signal peptide
MNTRKIVIAGAGAAAALSLIGVGAGASFTDAASASQSVTAGTINLQMSTDGGNFYKSVTFAEQGPVGSAGSTFTRELTVKNSGNLPVHVTSYTLSSQGDLPLSVSAAGFPLADGTNNLPVDVVLNPNTTQHVTLTFTVPALGNEYQGHGKVITLTANGAG